jgi:hypothetical protein
MPLAARSALELAARPPIAPPARRGPYITPRSGFAPSSAPPDDLAPRTPADERPAIDDGGGLDFAAISATNRTP